MKKAPTLKRTLLHCGILLLLLLVCVPLLWQAYMHFLRSHYPIKYEKEVNAAADACGLPPSLIYGIIHTESKFIPDAHSSADAKGLMQLTDETYKWALQRAGLKDAYNPESLYEPQTNIYCGTYVVSLLAKQFDDMTTVLAAYNAGQGRVRQWLDNPENSPDGKTLTYIPYAETREYTQRVLDAQKQYQYLYSIP